ncbi:MAG TPA: hypothetical protein PLU17_05885 [Chitinophagaceae bacterium]|jgi:antibiotic biosynthesis monooxygenase (ABM) superfamily enzyme|nr:hypothetical protein [Chitinophagaceae bacterium]
MSEEIKRTQPKRWKLAIIIWIGIYPTITLVLATLGRYILPLDIPIYLKTIPITLIVVPIMTFLILPNLQKVFGKWLTR